MWASAPTQHHRGGHRSSVFKNKRAEKNLCSFIWWTLGDFIPALSCLSPRRYIGSLPRRQKQSTGLFSSANYRLLPPCSSPLCNLKSKRAEKNLCSFIWWTLGDSNPRPPARQAGALPAELNVPVYCNGYYI